MRFLLVSTLILRIKVKKRRQHYIWKRYLHPWTTNGKIYCLRDKQIFNPGLDNIGNKRDFYKLVKLTNEDIDFIDKLYFQNIHPEYVKYIKDWIPTFNYIFKIKEFIDTNKFQSEKLNNKIEIVINNMLEDFHAKIETKSVSLLESLWKEDKSLFEDEIALDNLIYFLCLQYFRTNKIRESISSIPAATIYPQIKKIWNLCSIIFATNAAISFFNIKEKLRFVFLKSEKNNIITGDQPVINTYTNYNKSKKLKNNEIELYYPLTPRLAMLITMSEYYDKVDEKNLSEISVVHHNTQIYYASQDQIYADREDILKEFLLIPDLSRI